MAKEVHGTEHCRAGSAHAGHRAVAARVARVAEGSGGEIAREACKTTAPWVHPQTGVCDGSGGTFGATRTARCERWVAQAFLGAVHRDVGPDQPRLAGQWHRGRLVFRHGGGTAGADPAEPAQPGRHGRHRADRTDSTFGIGVLTTGHL